MALAVSPRSGSVTVVHSFWLSLSLPGVDRRLVCGVGPAGHQQVVKEDELDDGERLAARPIANDSEGLGKLGVDTELGPDRLLDLARGVARAVRS
jgi:hypothetical protein